MSCQGLFPSPQTVTARLKQIILQAFQFPPEKKILDKSKYNLRIHQKKKKIAPKGNFQEGHVLDSG